MKTCTFWRQLPDNGVSYSTPVVLLDVEHFVSALSLSDLAHGSLFFFYSYEITESVKDWFSVFVVRQ